MYFPSIDEIKELALKHGYVLKEQIGTGQFGRAYKILSLKYSQDFVLKFIPLRKSSIFGSQKMEHETLQQLTHPNILSIYEVWEEMGGISLITEYCPNGSYEQIIKDNGKIQLQQFILVARQLLSALDYLHKKGFSHNDIKPANILIDAYGRPKLADFGLCAVSDGKCNETIVRGTMLTMAPELFKGKPYNSLKSDIWSMGITLYIMAVGTTPWGNKAKDIHVGAVSGSVDYPFDLDGRVVKLLSKMLQPYPELRPDIDVLLQSPIFKKQSQCIDLSRSRSAYGITKKPVFRNASKLNMRRNMNDVSSPTFTD